MIKLNIANHAKTQRRKGNAKKNKTASLRIFAPSREL